ncbi:hypothetical protein MAXJ12_00205 [Mesorhizobium alhagi CCNWXJ12-2]|uniref:Uncharacterized protein n=1 Tax=Mesorhizobium alhagi CCNWXJ12-2 TaxID=1107882 RepID=H0HIT7_9HYPH|nr:hypothetical protein MAXJ12_00205 [Mesorhizobium alhagi CCNWXJ12-2]
MLWMAAYMPEREGIGGGRPTTASLATQDRSVVIATNNWNEFPAAIRRKFLLEIAHKPTRRARSHVVLL